MDRLLELRNKIDSIDKEIIRLFEERMAAADGVAAYKRSVGKAVLDRTREKEKIASVRALTSSEFNAQGAASLLAS